MLTLITTVLYSSKTNIDIDIDPKMGSRTYFGPEAEAAEIDATIILSIKLLAPGARELECAPDPRSALCHFF